MERTLAFVKPDGVHRGIVGEIIQRFEKKGLRLIGLKMVQLPSEVVCAHYHEHEDKPFYDALVNFVLSGPIVLMALEGPQAIQVVRTLVGPTNGIEAPPGTIRGDFGISNQFNLIHASDGPESAQRELSRFFPEHELVSWKPIDTCWKYNTD